MRRAVSGVGLLVVLWAAVTPAAVRGQASGQTPAGGPAWPVGAAAARVRFSRTIDPGVMRGRPSAFSRFLRVIVGAADAPPVMEQPYGTAIGPDGRLYVTDAGSGTIHVYGIDRQFYRALHVDGSASLIGITFFGRRLAVTDSVGARVVCLDLDGRRVWTLDRKDGLARPTGITYAAGRLFVVDTLGNRVISVSTDGKVLGTFGRRGVEPGQLNYPTSIASDASGRLYVVDTMNFRVQTFSAEGRALGTFGQLGDGAGDFDKPKGIAVDAEGLIYVVEGIHDVVKIFDREGRVLLVFAGSGAGPGDLWLPTGIALAGSRVFVADSANRRVQEYERLGGAP